MKKVVIDKFIPFEGNPFEGVAEIERLAPADINADTVRDADALIVRTRTRCDASLLENSRVGIVATATIGTDHLDFPYLASRGIKTVSAPGCNAPAVAQYVLASIFSLGLGDPGMRLGIVGLGHVGSIVASWALNFGMDVYACDIPRQSREHGWNPAAPLTAGDVPFCQLEEIARKCDAVTFHTPLTRSGECPTFHLLDRDFLSVAPKALVINSARGPVADTADLIAALRRGRVDNAAMDCWEGEPGISDELLRLSRISTPHIAGYSIEGKKRATAVTFNAVLEYLGSDRRIDPGVPLTAPAAVSRQAVTDSYDPLADSIPLKSDPSSFESLRNHYPLRHEVPFKS